MISILPFMLHPQPVENLKMNVEPYLFFDGRCEEALEFYGKTLGAEVDAC